MADTPKAGDEKAAADKGTSPEPAALTERLLIDEAYHRFGVEPYVVAGALAGKMRGDTMSVDRAQKLINDFLKEEGSMEESE